MGEGGHAHFFERVDEFVLKRARDEHVVRRDAGLAKTADGSQSAPGAFETG